MANDTIEFEVLKCVGILNKQPTVNFIKAKEMTEAQMLDYKGEIPSAIVMSACDENGGCQYRDKCELLDKIDDHNYEIMRDLDIVPAVQIRFCNKYKTKYEWSRRGF